MRKGYGPSAAETVGRSIGYGPSAAREAKTRASVATLVPIDTADDDDAVGTAVCGAAVVGACVVACVACVGACVAACVGPVGACVGAWLFAPVQTTPFGSLEARPCLGTPGTARDPSTLGWERNRRR